jgi:hypothetical protein
MPDSLSTRSDSELLPSSWRLIPGLTVDGLDPA